MPEKDYYIVATRGDDPPEHKLLCGPFHSPEEAEMYLDCITKAHEQICEEVGEDLTGVEHAVGYVSHGTALPSEPILDPRQVTL